MVRGFGGVCLAACVAALAAGCGVQGQDTPCDTMLKVYKAMRDGNGSALVECFDVNAEQAELLNAIGSIRAAENELDDACVKTFGEERCRQSFGREMTRPPFDDSIFQKAAVKVDGDSAEVTIPGEPRSHKLAKKDGVWKLAFTDLFPNTENVDLKVQAKLFGAMATAIRTASVEARRPLATPDSVQQKIIEETAKAARATMPSTPKGPMPKGEQ
jgi:hypothetical protein